MYIYIYKVYQTHLEYNLQDLGIVLCPPKNNVEYFDII